MEEPLYLISTINRIAIIAEGLYGEERVSFNIGDKHVSIHYPEINLTSPDERSHKITDIYVQFRITGLTISLFGTRGSATCIEILRGYAHSHLPSFNSIFCLGNTSSDFAGIFRNLYMNEYLNDDEILYTLLSLERYLAWESSNTRPHYKIETLDWNNIRLDSEIINNITQTILKNPLIYDIENNNIVPIEGRIISLLSNIKEMTSRSLINNRLENKIKQINKQNISFFNFHGEFIKMRVTDEIPDNQITKLKITDNLVEKIKMDANSKIFNNLEQIKQYVYNKSNGRDVFYTISDDF